MSSNPPLPSPKFLGINLIYEAIKKKQGTFALLEVMRLRFWLLEAAPGEPVCDLDAILKCESFVSHEHNVSVL